MRTVKTVMAPPATISTPAAAAFIAPALTSAVGGTASYAAWVVSGANADATFANTVFPAVSAEVNPGSISAPSGASVWLTEGTAFGAVYGSSRNHPYLSVGLPGGKNEGSLTLTFAGANTPGTWGFALGDIDAEDVTITAKSASGFELDVSTWFKDTFNYCNTSTKPTSCPAGTSTGEPTWNAETATLKGYADGHDTSGDAAWFQPSKEVKTLTLTQKRISGFPSYQLWIAADEGMTIASSPAPSETAVDCTVGEVTQLVNGGFESPVLAAKTFKQINEANVPGWSTTASDHLIELWSDGFNKVESPAGSQFAELNATQDSELFQVVPTVPGQELTWTLYHRARAAAAIGDTMSVRIGAAGADPDSVTEFTDALSDGWVLHTGVYVVPKGQTETRFGFASGRTASGNKGIGNFLDNINFTATECLSAQATAQPASPSSSASATPSPSVSATATPSPSASPSVSTTATAEPSLKPTAPVEVLPDEPTVITVADLPIVPAGAEPTQVTQPDNGKAQINNGEISYTPEKGFVGTDEFTVTFTQKDGSETAVVVTVSVGKDQVPTPAITLPVKLVNGTNLLLAKQVVTNAGNTVKVSATCSPLARMQPRGDVRACVVVKQGLSTYLRITTDEPIGVTVNLTAPAVGKYSAYKQVQVYFVR